jgi:ferredoxin-NADP reductase
VRVRGPRNHFELKEAPAYHFIAGGIGVTPILPMIRHAEATAATWTMTYGGRQRTSMAFLTELDVFSEKVTILPQDEAGLPDLASIIGNLAKGTVIYCCGPEGLLSAVENVCMEIGAPPPRLERFAPKKITERENTAFDVVLQESGKTFRVPADRSILDVLRDGGIDTIASCEEGTCGTCETGVLEGTPEHRDSVLTSAEQAANEFMMICVSRSCSDCLVLEL